MKKESAFDRILERTPLHTTIMVAKSLDISEQVRDILSRKGWDQVRLAKALGKSESEISKWLSGMHNLTLKSIAKMEAVLGEEIIVTPRKATKRGMPEMKPLGIEEIRDILSGGLEKSQSGIAGRPRTGGTQRGINTRPKRSSKESKVPFAA